MINFIIGEKMSDCMFTYVVGLYVCLIWNYFMIYPCIPAGILHKYSDGVREPESNKKSRSPFKSVVLKVCEIMSCQESK